MACQDYKIVDAFKLLNISSIYAEYNATGNEVIDNIEYIRKYRLWLSKIIDNKSNNIALEEICYNIKSDTVKFLGNYSPYKEVFLIKKGINQKTFFLQKNNNGFILQGEKEFFYLGKSCDVLDKKMKKGLGGIIKNYIL
ncbi:hypothetical protein [Conservatibacter flavescens]|uniref:Uncharacterized protein n=1 Tax=Conservatibacter flavescens TaxID=28161 RepID=A0A2M8RZH4_9PAST|nr:hypothetical protein [Conservatibacter flavescens]PJG84292.1 hypothetical protein CVP05_12110 [Conservatibacter flavescens]